MARLLDMSKIALPNAVELLDFEQLLADRKQRYATLMGLTLQELRDTDPVIRAFEVEAYRETLKRARANDSVRNTLLSHATGQALDDIGAQPVYNLDRLVLDPGDPGAVPPIDPTYEHDDDYRARLQAAPNALSVAGPEGAYWVHAMGAHPDVVDVQVTSPNPCEILVQVLHDSADPDILTDVEAALTPTDVRPFGDRVTVQAAANEPSSLTLRVYVPDGPDLSAVEAAAQERVDALILPIAAQVGSGQQLSAGDGDWRGAAMVEGVTDVEELSSTGMTNPLAAWWPMSITVQAFRIGSGP